MTSRIAKADVIPVRQQNQYNCVTTSLCMALRALGVPEDECSPARVNKVVGAMPLQGAAWEPMLAAANHYGMRATLTLPSTVRQLKSWTDAGKPVVIAWNPEGREWSHASLVFDVDDDLNVYVADPNIPDPDETVRVVPKSEFYSKWYEKAPQGFLIRRPACVIEREITPDGRQVMASRRKTAGVVRDSIMEIDTYEVAETSRSQPLSLTPVVYALDDWEYIGEDGGVSVSWGQKSALMDRREFAAFAEDMKKALAWAKRYDYSKGKMASRVASRYQKQSGDPSVADALHELQVAAEALENAHIMLTSRHMGPSPKDDFSQAREAADFLEKMSAPLDRHIKALRRI